MTKVLLYSNRENEIDRYAELINSQGLPIDLLVCRNENDLYKAIAEAEIIFGVHLPASAYEKAKKLRWIQSMWAGVEPLMKLGLPGEVIITKPWGVFGKFLSHYVFGNLLALKIHFQEAREAQARQDWSPYRIETLNGRCMGIAGTGDIGTEIAAVAASFGMQTWGLNSDGRACAAFDRCFAMAERADFVTGLDVLVLTLPATPLTRGMFSQELLCRLKPEAIVINVGRGALIDDEALIDLLERKKIAAAVLDVFNEEPLPKEHPYWSLPNCIMTPHIGGPSLPEDITSCFLKNLSRYLNGEALLGVVHRERGY